MSTLTVKVLTVILPGVKVLRSPHLPGGMVDLLPTLWAPGGAIVDLSSLLFWHFSCLGCDIRYGRSCDHPIGAMELVKHN